jgi:Terpene cyclase DEP1
MSSEPIGSLSPGWLPVLALLLVGVSLALPMFLYMRELQLERSNLSEQIAMQ